MITLFDAVPLQQDFSTFATKITVLPLSLQDFKKLWYDSDGPNFANDLHKDKHPQNKLIS